MPSLVSALTDVRGPGSGGQQPLKLSVLVAANRADVEVQPEQAGERQQFPRAPLLGLRLPATRTSGGWGGLRGIHHLLGALLQGRPGHLMGAAVRLLLDFFHRAGSGQVVAKYFRKQGGGLR